MTLKTKEIGVFGAEKRRKILAGRELGKNLLEDGVWGDLMYEHYSVLMEYGYSVDKIGLIF